MHGPTAAGWLLVALCAASGGYCLLRWRAGPGGRGDTAGGEAVMGFGMAVMAVPAAALTPPREVWLVYAVVFGGAALHALGHGTRGSGHRLHHLIGTLAMVYMAGAMAAAPTGAHGAAAGHMPSGAPLATGVLLIYYTVYVLRAGTRLLPVAVPAGPEEVGPVGGTPRGDIPGGITRGAVAGRVVTDDGTARGGATGGGTAVVPWGARAELALACRLSMGLAMLAMLLSL
ncbi:DUF5134 domain-containing protein [Streptomyces sp. NPDC001780]